MLQRSFFMFFVFLLIVFSQGIVFNSGQTQQTQQSNTVTRPFTDLTLEINIPTQNPLPLQPIPVIIKQSNRTNQPALGYKSIGFNSPIYFYVQSDGNSERVQISQLTNIASLTAFKNVEIKPGESSVVKEWITLGLNQYFPEAGTYELQAVLYNADGTQSIESNKINIEIQEPTGANRNAYNLIKNNPFVAYLFSDAEFDKKKEILEAITTRFPNSGYAKSAFYVIGERYFMRKQYPQALTNLLRLENDGNFIFAEKVRNYLAEIRRLPLNEQQENEKNQ